MGKIKSNMEKPSMGTVGKNISHNLKEYIDGNIIISPKNKNSKKHSGYATPVLEPTAERSPTMTQAILNVTTKTNKRIPHIDTGFKPFGSKN